MDYDFVNVISRNSFGFGIFICFELDTFIMVDQPFFKRPENIEIEKVVFQKGIDQPFFRLAVVVVNRSAFVLGMGKNPIKNNSKEKRNFMRQNLMPQMYSFLIR